MHKFSKFFVILTGAFFVSTLASADTSAAKKLYKTKTCFTCHGENGEGALIGYPELAGQNAKYALRQMQDIAKGKRVGSNDNAGIPSTQNMKNAMQTMDKKQMKVIAKWLAQKPPFMPDISKKASDENIAKGAELYKKFRCSTCHGKAGAKPRKGDPFLAGQKHDYLTQQMKDIRDKVRTNGRSKTMVSFIKKVSDEDIGYLADYLSQTVRK